LCYLVARELDISTWLAVAGAVVLAAFPVFIFTSIQPLSDTLATTWTLAALLCALRACRANLWASACGAAFAVAVLVRPTNLMLMPALLVLLGLDWKKIALCLASGVPGAVWMAFYNHTLYGGVFESGYGRDLIEAFAVRHGLPAVVHFAKWLALLLPAALLVLPIMAWARRTARTRELLALTLAFAAIVTLYAFYEFSSEVWWSLRFILPAVPALILMGLLGLETFARDRDPRSSAKFRAIVAAVLALWSIGNSWFWSPQLHVFMMKHYEQAYADGSLAARDRLPKNALVVSFAFSGSLYFYTDFPVLRWDQIEPPVFARYAAKAQAAGRPICAVLFESEEESAFRHCPGEWTRLATIRNVGLWQLAAPKS
jgi:4-amino-4-deoxy-L-arabinose transferase-like glycosyltransferase